MRLAFASVLALLVACGSSREPSYHALEPRGGPARVGAGAPSLVELRRPSIAGYLDRADIVKHVRDYQLGIDDGARWAEPLSDMISRVLARDLGARLRESHVFMESGAIAAQPDATVAIDILRFDPGEDGRLSLVAEVAIEPGTSGGEAKRTQVRTFELARTAPRGDTARQVEAMSVLLADLSDGVVDMLRHESGR